VGRSAVLGVSRDAEVRLVACGSGTVAVRETSISSWVHILSRRNKFELNLVEVEVNRAHHMYLCPGHLVLARRLPRVGASELMPPAPAFPFFRGVHTCGPKVKAKQQRAGRHGSRMDNRGQASYVM
jgi:hypothetical protein